MCGEKIQHKRVCPISEFVSGLSVIGFSSLSPFLLRALILFLLFLSGKKTLFGKVGDDKYSTRIFPVLGREKKSCLTIIPVFLPSSVRNYCKLWGFPNRLTRILLLDELMVQITKLFFQSSGAINFVSIAKILEPLIWKGEKESCICVLGCVRLSSSKYQKK